MKLPAWIFLWANDKGDKNKILGITSDPSTRDRMATVFQLAKLPGRVGVAHYFRNNHGGTSIKIIEFKKEE